MDVFFSGDTHSSATVHPEEEPNSILQPANPATVMTDFPRPPDQSINPYSDSVEVDDDDLFPISVPQLPQLTSLMGNSSPGNGSPSLGTPVRAVSPGLPGLQIQPPQGPRGILREQHKLGASPKQLSFDVPPSPALSAKSSLVSHSGSSNFYPDSRTRAASASLRRKERCAYGPLSLEPPRDPSKFRLANLNQRSNSESCFHVGRGQHFLTANELNPSHRRCSMAILPSREQALLRRILGPQGLSWIGGLCKFLRY